MVFALTWGSVQLLVMPPFQVPDEPHHFFRAWGVSRLQLVNRDLNLALPEQVVTLVQNISRDRVENGAVRVSQLLPYFQERITRTERVVGERFCAYNPLGYLPQAAGIRLAAALDLSPLHAFYFGRFFNLLCAGLLIFWAISAAPWGRDIFLLVSLFPMTVHQLASLSNDALTLAGLLLFTSQLLYFSTKPRLSAAALFYLAALSLVLVHIKPGYIAYLLLFFVLSSRQFSAGRRYYIYLLTVFWANLAMIYMLSNLIEIDKYVALIHHISTRDQLQFIIENPHKFLIIFINTLFQQPIFTFKSMIGVLGWLNLFFPDFFYVFMVIAFGLIVLTNNDTVMPTLRQRAVFFSIALGTLFIILTLQYLFWTELKAPYIITFQGRYFIAVCALVLLGFHRPGIVACSRDSRFQTWRYRIICLVFFIISVYTSLAVIHHYKGYYSGNIMYSIDNIIFTKGF